MSQRSSRAGSPYCFDGLTDTKDPILVEGERGFSVTIRFGPETHVVTGCHANHSLRSLREKAAVLGLVPLADVHFYYQYELLEDDNKTLGELGIGEHARILCF